MINLRSLKGRCYGNQFRWRIGENCHSFIALASHNGLEFSNNDDNTWHTHTHVEVDRYSRDGSNCETRSIWKMLGPFTTASRLTPTHQMSLAVLSRAACASMSTTTTTTRDRWDRYGPMEWAQWDWSIRGGRLTVPKRCISRYFSVDGFIPDEASFDPTLCKHQHIFISQVFHIPATTRRALCVTPIVL